MSQDACESFDEDSGPDDRPTSMDISFAVLANAAAVRAARNGTVNAMATSQIVQQILLLTYHHIIEQNSEHNDTRRTHDDH
jgi:hypothetical protein